MAYITQEKKKEIAPVVKNILKKYGMKGSLSIRHLSVLVLTIRSGKLDIIQNCHEKNKNRSDYSSTTYEKGHQSVNEFWLNDNYTGDCLDFLKEIKAAMNDGNHDNSDPQTDYFDVGWYVNINVGKWDKPYVLNQ